jgi:L-serine/L-threonine ammonia-lyase
MMSIALTSLCQAGSPSQPPPRVHFYCSSGGNAGLACATTAIALGNSPVTIVVPTSASEFMVSKLRDLGAEVIQTGATWAEADAYLRETFLKTTTNTEEDERRVYVPPFDHPDIWSGVATLVGEIVRQLPHGNSGDGQPVTLDGVVCNVGGGGLLNGVMEGLERNAKLLAPSKPKVLAVETVGADSLFASVQAGRLLTLPGITSVALSLGATRVSAKTWEWATSAKGNLISATVTDKEAVMGCARFLDDARMLIEVACGATVAMAYNGGLRRHLGEGLTDEEWAKKNVVLVV